MPPKTMSDSESFNTLLHEIIEKKQFSKLEGLESSICHSIISKSEYFFAI